MKCVSVRIPLCHTAKTYRELILQRIKETDSDIQFFSGLLMNKNHRGNEDETIIRKIVRLSERKLNKLREGLRILEQQKVRVRERERNIRAGV